MPTRRSDPPGSSRSRSCSISVDEVIAKALAPARKRGIAESLCSLGGLAYQRADFKQAIDRYQESLRLRLDLGDRLGAAILLWNLAEAAEQVDSPFAAVALYREAERQFRELRSVYVSAATEALDRMQQTLPPEISQDVVAAATTKSWEDWAWTVRPLKTRSGLGTR